MRMLGILALAGVCAVTGLFALPAFGDIKSFNAAVNAGDFKKAAAEATATWPTLDKSREDIALIAREFGFVSYVAKDYAAAKKFAEFAAAKTTEDAAAAEIRSQSSVLLRLSELKLRPSGETRDALFRSLEARSGLAGFDNISFAATDALVAYDLDKGRWRDAAASTDIGAKLAVSGGPSYSVERRRYELYGGVADYMVTRKASVFQQFTDLRTSLLTDIAAAPSEKSAQRFVPLFWEASGWREALDAHLITIKARGHTPVPPRQRDNIPDPDGRLERLLGKNDDFGACPKKFDAREKPNYPVSAMYEGFTGAVILRVDIDAEGKASNPEILAAVPDKYFGDAVLRNVKDMRYLPGDAWDPATCSLAQKGHIIVFKFLIRRR